jgi:hypothetical protein
LVRPTCSYNRRSDQSASGGPTRRPRHPAPPAAGRAGRCGGDRARSRRSDDRFPAVEPRGKSRKTLMKLVFQDKIKRRGSLGRPSIEPPPLFPMETGIKFSVAQSPSRG